MKSLGHKIFLITGIVFLFILGTLSCKYQGKKERTSLIKGEAGKHFDQLFTPYCQGIMKDFDLPGLAIGIVKDKEIVYARAFGYCNINTSEPLSLNSMFHVASISKPFVATAIMQLVEEGRVHLDSTVASYLPYFKLQGAQYDQITIVQILNHISGMPDVHDYQWDHPVYDAGALERYVRGISEEEMIASPGQVFAYSNMAFECLGDVIAKVSGISFADYVKQNILEPSGMTESSFLMPEYLPENWATPHLRFSKLEPWDGYPYNRMHGPSSTLHSSTLELCNWAITNMNRGAFENRRILADSSYNLLWKPWFKTGEESSVGLSWFLDKYKGETTVGHAGGDIGFSTNLLMLPEKSIAVVVLCNLNSSPIFRITNAALDILHGDEPEPYQIPAIIPVSRELEQKGVDAAYEMWQSLKSMDGKKYNFKEQLYGGLYNAILMKKESEAQMLASLYVQILNEEELAQLKTELDRMLSKDLENEALRSAIQVLGESM